MDFNGIKILQLGKFYPMRGGVEKVIYDLMTGLSEMDIYCDMVCAAIEGKSRIKVVNEHARLITCRTWIKAAATMISPAMIMELRKRKKDYDIIHIHHPDPMACLALFLSGYKGKVVLQWHSDILKQKFLLEIYRPLQSWLLKRADIVIGTTPVYLKESKFLKDVQHKAVCLPIGVEPIVPDSRKVDAIRENYKDKKIVFSLGRLVEYKGFRYLIEASKYLDDSFIILIGGTGPLKDELIKIIEDNGLAGKVKLLGKIPDELLSSYYGACDVFCLSSVMKTEAFGIVQIEAMSCGKPIVATNIPQSGVSYVNEHGVSGLNVEPSNPKRLAEAIMNITKDETTYKAFSEGAFKRYSEFFTKESMINNCRNIYQNNI